MKITLSFYTLFALVAAFGVDAFSPSSMKSSKRGGAGVSSSTSLKSHFTCINTKLYNKESLLKALRDLGIQNIQTTSSSSNKEDNQRLIARGYQGNTMEADIVIPQANNYDVAFCYDGKTYQLVADLQFWQQSMPVDAFMEKVQQKYAIHTLVDTSAQEGFQVETVTQSVDGTVTMQLSRYNTAGM
ncbi:DUF1257 domain containing protein [Nitzschia inconspicua]|uniref:Uncharacterized protein ycf35 n=1 Tax=Nitzschia inconspicua TaxID=303405 RepID=A0A9K3LSL6_9STRA|nr:DUF1257 domain containing protein [Nitzschia inconspicua]KAG7367804.1 DUF1257 domain containing protein [Nitzschia inconspicua]